jgi:hypothetical protein
MTVLEKLCLVFAQSCWGHVKKWLTDEGQDAGNTSEYIRNTWEYTVIIKSIFNYKRQYCTVQYGIVFITILSSQLIAIAIHTITSQPSNRSVAIISNVIYTIFSNSSLLDLEHRHTGVIKDICDVDFSRPCTKKY